MSNVITKDLGVVAPVPKGNYSLNTYYEKLNIVQYGGSSYIAVKPSTGILPTNTEYWQFIGGITTVNEVDVIYDTLEDMISDTEIVFGQYVRIRGYYDKSDNGEAIFYIREAESGEDLNNKILLDNGLIADVIEDLSVVQYIFPKNWGNTLSGDANIIIAYGKIILIDSHRAGNKTQLYEMFNKYNINHIDYFINTHYHDDHVGNFINLVNDGYVDETTKIYLPGYTDLIQSKEQMRTYYTNIGNCIEENSLDAHIPDEGETVELGLNFKITFYNCEQSIFDRMGYTDYNFCSTICLIEHNNIKSLYTGDCGKLNRLIDEELIEDKISLHKIAHHGINTTSDEVYFLRFGMPDYAVQPSGMGDEVKNNYSNCATISFLTDIGAKIYSVHEQTEEIEFCSYDGIMKNIVGKRRCGSSGGTYRISLYCDITTTSTKQNGTQQYPYKDLPQAVENIIQSKNGEYSIYLADGSYNVSHPSNSKNVPHIKNSVVRLYGNNSDNTAVKLNYQTEARNSNIFIQDINFVQNEKQPLLLVNSYAYIDNCLFSLDTNAEPKTGIYGGGGSNINVINTTFENIANAISLHDGDTASLYNCIFDSITGHVFLVNNATIRKSGNTFTNCDYPDTTYSNNGLDLEQPMTKRKTLFNGSTTSNQITLSDNIYNYNCLLITYGFVSSGLRTAMILSYSSATFIRGGKYTFPMSTDDVTLEVDNNNAKLIKLTHSDGGNDTIRTIYGIVLKDM